jgi:Skp family chaperone for outer membrane proteins
MWNYRLGVGIATIGLGVTLLAAAGYGGPATGKDRDKGDTSGSIGFVDLNQVSDEVKKTPSWQKMVSKATDTRTKLSQELDDLVQRRHLNDAEVKELAELEAKPKATDPEKERISKLLRKSDEIDKEFNDLANTPNLTAEQSARLTTLTKLRADAGQKLQQARAEREQKLQEMEGEMLNELQNKILKVVSDVARGQNVEVVIDKQALLYGGRDLTTLVIQKMPKS